MSKPFDATCKELLEAGPHDWLEFLGRPATNARLLNVDLSTVTASVDRVILVEDADDPHIEHLEFQAGPDTSKPRTMNLCSSLLENQYDIPIETTLILLRREANLTVYNGHYTRKRQNASKTYRHFEYNVIRVWELSPDVLLRNIATMPLATVANTPEDQLPAVIDSIKQQMKLVSEPDRVGELWTSVRVLMGLKYNRAFVNRLLREVQGMEESDTYQEIKESGVYEGRVAEASRILVRLGTKRFRHSPALNELSAIESIRSAERLEEILDRIDTVGSWAELLGLPPT